MILRHTLSVLLAAVLVLLLTTSAGATKHIVNVANFSFTPAKTHVAPGDTVRWVYVNGISHTTTSDLTSTKAWNSPALSALGDFFEVVFNESDGPGPFPYHCSFHPLAMMDTIFVNLPASIHVIKVSDFAYTPAKTHVNPGDTVIWEWQNGSHTTTSDPSSPKAWASPVLSGIGQFFQVVFSVADGFGPFPYHCEVHPLAMFDTIFVNGAPPPCTSCGDANSDASIDISDAVFLIQYIFAGGTAPGPCITPNGKGDANGDGGVDISDAVYLIQYIFAGGPAPHCP
jgi:plastocyanin